MPATVTTTLRQFSLQPITPVAGMARSYALPANNKARLCGPGLAGAATCGAGGPCRTRYWCSLGNSNPYFSLERATS